MIGALVERRSRIRVPRVAFSHALMPVGIVSRTLQGALECDF